MQLEHSLGLILLHYVESASNAGLSWLLYKHLPVQFRFREL